MKTSNTATKQIRILVNNFEKGIKYYKKIGDIITVGNKQAKELVEHGIAEYINETSPKKKLNEKEILSMRLKEAELSLHRFLKLNNKIPPNSETGWEKHPRSFEEIKLEKSYGIAGREELVLIDIDNKKMINIIRQKLPPTFETISPRRKLPHFYYKVTNGEVQNTTLHLPDVKEGCGEIRAQNQYLVAPGSIINYKNLTTKKWETGKYKILNDRPIATVTYNIFMKVITPLLKSKDDPQGTQKITYKQMREGVPKGTRHQQGMKYATFLIKVKKFDAATTLHEMLAWNKKNRPPMNTKDLERMIKNAIAYPDRKTPEKTLQEKSITLGTYTLQTKKDKIYLINAKGEKVLINKISSFTGPRFTKKLENYTGLSEKEINKKIANFYDEITETTPFTPEEEPSYSEQIIELCHHNDAIFFHDQYKTPHMQIKTDDVFVTYVIRSRTCKRFLSKLLYDEIGKVPNQDSLGAAILLLEAFASDKTIKLHNRVASTKEGDDLCIWIDMCNDKWQVIRVTKNEWKIVDGAEAPILFRRHSHMMPLCIPIHQKNDGINDINDIFAIGVPGGFNNNNKTYNNLEGGTLSITKIPLIPSYRHLSKFLDFTNIPTPSDQLLLLIITINYYIPNIPHPVLTLYGISGSGKTFLFKIIRSLLDPSSLTEPLSLPRTTKELIQQLYHHYLAFYDNITHISSTVSAEFCRAVTGSGSTKRALFTDDEDIIYNYKRCIGLNSINVAATQADLLNRIVLQRLTAIEDKDRKEETPFLEEFEKKKPLILGELLDVLVETLRLYPTTKPKELSRMADFTRWGCAIAKALGKTEKDFIEAYREKIDMQIREAAYASVVANTLLDFMEFKPDWEGTPSALYKLLIENAKELGVSTRVKEWPKAPNSLSRRLNDLSHSLRVIGLEIITFRTEKKRMLTIINHNNDPANNEFFYTELHEPKLGVCEKCGEEEIVSLTHSFMFEGRKRYCCCSCAAGVELEQEKGEEEDLELEQEESPKTVQEGVQKDVVVNSSDVKFKKLSRLGEKCLYCKTGQRYVEYEITYPGISYPDRKCASCFEKARKNSEDKWIPLEEASL